MGRFRSLSKVSRTSLNISYIFLSCDKGIKHYIQKRVSVFCNAYNMPSSCCIKGCSNKQTYDGYSLFGFPNDPDMKNQWLEAIGLDRSEFKTHHRVCEVHFKPELIHFVGSRKELDKSAVPSLFCDCDYAEVTGLIEAAKSANSTDKFSSATTREHSYSSSPNLVKSIKKEKDWDAERNVELSSLSKRCVKHSPDCNILRVPLKSTPKSLPDRGSSTVPNVTLHTIVPVNIPHFIAAPYLGGPSNISFKKVTPDNRKLKVQLQNALDENAKLKRELSMLKGILVPVRPLPPLKACKNVKLVQRKK